MKTHDFRNPRWGHALHPATWRELPPRQIGKLWWKKLVPRASVTVHCGDRLAEGDLVVYHAQKGAVFKVVAEVQPLGNPCDMYTLVLEHPHLAE